MTILRSFYSSIPLAALALGAVPAPAASAPDLTSPTATLGCLAAAVYYEARSESLAGQRAVAQVVLNRTRHPAYPRSVCGVVLQGATRSTGCQFTFTCDRSLARLPKGSAWSRAVAVATEALASPGSGPVGNATHYHTTAIRPSWAGAMAEIGTVGSHIFYDDGRARRAEAPIRLQAAVSEQSPPPVRRQASARASSPGGVKVHRGTVPLLGE